MLVVLFFACHWWIGKLMQRLHKSIILLNGWALLSKLWCLLSTMTRVYYQWFKLQKGLQWNTLTLQILILVNSFKNMSFCYLWWGHDEVMIVIYSKILLSIHGDVTDGYFMKKIPNCANQFYSLSKDRRSVNISFFLCWKLWMHLSRLLMSEGPT